MNSIITISRQYGSGGRFIAKLLAEKLGIPYYDNELITMAAKESGYSEAIFEKAEQLSTHSFLYSLSMFGSVDGIYGLPLADKVYIAQSEIIKKCADKGPCVIVGRCSDYVLKDYNNVINYFIYSDEKSKIDRAVKYYGISAENAAAELKKKDKKRANYYNYYTSQSWGDFNNYHLSLNSDAIGIDACVDILASHAIAFNK
ncbi:MAG: cytidylate kinase-like family protein [Clostridia bacterium]|nr:cytidylate kinase-like family protein [Clostridia bacterium]